MIDEFDEMQIVIESDDDSDECTITRSNSTAENSNVMKWEYLYNLKKEIKIKVLQHTLAKSEDNYQ